MLRTSAFALGLAIVSSSCTQPGQSTAGLSPDGAIGITAGISPAGAFQVAIRHRGKTLVAPSPAGIMLADRPFRALAETARETIVPATGCTGERVSARETVQNGRQLILETSACNDGAAFRLVAPARPGADPWRIAGESTRFVTARNDACLGVRHAKFFNSHEGDYRPVRLQALKHDDLVDLPPDVRDRNGGRNLRAHREQYRTLCRSLSDGHGNRRWRLDPPDSAPRR
ncbi:glycoside hydrolase family 97 N-terminal domain-containing protein [Sphingomonas sp. H160509]|nr:glycoside hydrolase family 97 N-terminal domain-containing protein [Sphingomonas sp. H160509]MDD1449853.1 glycoside hydrolase family 97 N-terminal domain-containing protein [Sphingomonas sp. H160509]